MYVLLEDQSEWICFCKSQPDLVVRWFFGQALQLVGEVPLLISQHQPEEHRFKWVSHYLNFIESDVEKKMFKNVAVCVFS